MDGRTSAARIADVLREVGADVIALQEVLDHQAEAISAEIGLPFVIGENRKHHGYGVRQRGAQPVPDPADAQLRPERPRARGARLPARRLDSGRRACCTSSTSTSGRR